MTQGGPAHFGERRISQVTSADGTPIVMEREGRGPTLLIVHGGTGDRTRWTPMFPHLCKHFTVCAMDRRAHGQSGDGPCYSLQHEVDDVLAVVASLKAPVALLGHSFGGVVAYEAALRSPLIGQLVLYEPPLLVAGHDDVLADMEARIACGDRPAATAMFMRDVVQVAPVELEAMQRWPSWPQLVASIEMSIRQHRALSEHRWDPARASALRTPTLLIIGSRTQNPDLRRSVQHLASTLPVNQLVSLDGQGHNAMDAEPAQLAAVVKRFLLETL